MKFAVQMEYATMKPCFVVGRRWFARVDTTQPFGGTMREPLRSVSRVIEFSGGLTVLLEVAMTPEGATAELTLAEPPN